MSPTAEPSVLHAARSLIKRHPAAPELPADLAVHAAILLTDEQPHYTRASYLGEAATMLVFTVVTSTRVLQLTAATGRRDEGVGIETAVRELAWPAA